MLNVFIVPVIWQCVCEIMWGIRSHGNKLTYDIDINGNKIHWPMNMIEKAYAYEKFAVFTTAQQGIPTYFSIYRYGMYRYHYQYCTYVPHSMHPYWAKYSTVCIHAYTVHRDVRKYSLDTFVYNIVHIRVHAALINEPLSPTYILLPKTSSTHYNNIP